MRLTLINQFYPPDLAPTGHMAASLAEHRAELGDEVTVITSLGGYVPESGKASPAAGDNPHVHRLWTPKLGKASFLKRLVDYSLFTLQAGMRMATLPRQDVVVFLTTPPFIAWTAVLHRRLHPETRLVLWSMDCYPEVLERAGVISPDSRVSRFMRWLNRRLFRRLDHVVCLDAAMERLLTSQYQPEGGAVPTSVIANWEPLSQFAEDLNLAAWAPARELGLESKFVVLYLGNAGYGHRFETVIEAAEQLREENVAFVFVGGGEKWRWLEEEKDKRSLGSLHLFRYVPKEMTPSVMACADCALITLRDAYLGVISPSKLHANLAMRLPVIYVGPEGGNVDEAIRRFDCGVSLRHGDVDGFVGAARSWIDRGVEFETLKGRARRAFEQAYSDQVALPRWDALLENV